MESMRVLRTIGVLIRDLTCVSADRIDLHLSSCAFN